MQWGGSAGGTRGEGEQGERVSAGGWAVQVGVQGEEGRSFGGGGSGEVRGEGAQGGSSAGGSGAGGQQRRGQRRRAAEAQSSRGAEKQRR